MVSASTEGSPAGVMTGACADTPAAPMRVATTGNTARCDMEPSSAGDCERKLRCIGGLLDRLNWWSRARPVWPAHPGLSSRAAVQPPCRFPRLPFDQRVEEVEAGDLPPGRTFPERRQ